MKYRIVKIIKQVRELYQTHDKEVLRFITQYELFKALVCYKKPINFKGMCEHIARAGFVLSNGHKPTPEEIFNYSNTGELAKVFEWYEDACAHIGPPIIDSLKETSQPQRQE